MSSKRIRAMEAKVDSHEKRLRVIEGALELLPVVTSFSGWKTLTKRDRNILRALHKYGVEGTSTTETAKDIDLKNPETSGRTIVLRRLRRIQEVSIRLKGFPLVVRDASTKKWSLNFDDFTFDLKEEKAS